MKRFLCLLLLTSIFIYIGQVNATSINIANFGFENPILPDGHWNYSIPDWTISGYSLAGVFNTTGFGIGKAPEGKNVAWLQGPTQISQTLSSSLTAYTKYTLQVEVGNTHHMGDPGYKVQLLAGGNLLTEDNNTLKPAPASEFLTSTISYTALPFDPSLGLDLEIMLWSLNYNEVQFDNVRLEGHIIPEPSTFLLLACGLIGLVCVSRKKFKK